MNWELLLLLLPVAAASGWYMGRRSLRVQDAQQLSAIPRDYFVGLNYLLNEQPDKAVDIFIKMLEVDSNTVETHMALGSLFRRRGEVDRAIRIHQNLIARPQLGKHQRELALLALGQDYMRAGVFDRAERLFLEVVNMGQEATAALKSLLTIYQQEKAWLQAIQIAEKLQIQLGQSMGKHIAHYHCELALAACHDSQVDLARKHLQQALSVDEECVRASLLQGNLAQEAEQDKQAIKAYKKIIEQDPDYLSEIMQPLAVSYQRLGDERGYTLFLKQCLQKYPRISVILALANDIKKQEGLTQAITFLAKQLEKQPSVRGLAQLIEMQLETQQEKHDGLLMLQDLLASLLAEQPIHRCIQCGYDGNMLLWLCPSCQNWNTIKPVHGLAGV